ncbi:hypothetical protein [Actinacidiphila bryophytorum]|uniref:hypothetical protein n=1 Tax=Actinacidiphila bryophytorum TaxID=1436133 RepID=UPI002176BDA3|nr:hypothetical protein [Actinacidiphila bryophytorum]UWE12757.1 hypothetical protein NYE86_31440 [Actinacidiphila bryophytorum]
MERNWPGVARVLAACAVLCGLFLMHGAPASAATGCHGMPVVAAQHAGMGEHGPAVHTPDGGETCVSTAPHERVQLPAPPLLAVVTLLVTAVCAQARQPRRGPPPRSGRPLLLQVCIART